MKFNWVYCGGWYFLQINKELRLCIYGDAINRNWELTIWTHYNKKPNENWDKMPISNPIYKTSKEAKKRARQIILGIIDDYFQGGF